MEEFRKITVNYAATACLQRNNNVPETLSLTVDIEDPADFDAVVEELRERVHKKLYSHERFLEAKSEIRRIENKLSVITQTYKKAFEKYDEMVEFMKAQGIKINFPELAPLDPTLVKALAPYQEDDEI